MKRAKNLGLKILFDIRFYMVLILITAVTTLVSNNLYLALAEFIILALLITAFFLERKTRKLKVSWVLKHIDNYINHFAKGYMQDLPIPVAVLDLTGTILWNNQDFSDIYGDDTIDKAISEVVKEIHILKIIENKDNIAFDVAKNGRYYKVLGNLFESNTKDKAHSVALYWIDKTAEVENYNNAVNSKVLACSILIDNYEDLIKNTPDTERSALVAEIDRQVELWVEGFNGVFRKYEKDRYYVYFENQYLKKLIDSKFKILDDIKEIDMENKIPATLSIAVGKGDGIKECEEFADAAMDMALGRGGDQAVIKEYNEPFKFLGGHSETSEKNTKVRARVVSNALCELVDQCDNIFVFGHKNADADCFGASVAMAAIAKNRGKKAYIILDNVQSGIEKSIDLLEEDKYYKDVFITEFAALQLIEKNSICVIVDTHNAELIEAPKVFEQVRHHVLIDHHRKGSDSISDSVLTYHESYASSTCELMTEIIQYMGDSMTITPHEAQAIYAGIVLDTKNFNVKTGVRTFEAATFLRRNGVDTTEVKKLFQNNISQYVKRAKIVSNATTYRKYFAVSSFESDEEFPTILAAQAADELLNVAEITASFVLCQQEDIIYISARSLGSFNVQLVMEQLGGGGHMTVAGAKIQGKQLTEVEKLLKKAIDNVE